MPQPTPERYGRPVERAPTLRAEVSAFLKSRRDRITPEPAGLPVYGHRRVPGLRRGEVAMLAGMSVEYYTRLERDDLSGASDSVLDALAQALRLDDTERDHLYALARAASATPARVRRRPKKAAVRPSVLRTIEGLRDRPAYVRNNRMDILAALARALHHEVFEQKPANTCRFVFLDPRATRLAGRAARRSRLRQQPHRGGEVVRVAGTGRSLPMALATSAFQVGIATGSWLGGIALTSGLGLKGPSLTGFAFALAALLPLGLLAASHGKAESADRPGRRTNSRPLSPRSSPPERPVTGCPMPPRPPPASATSAEGGERTTAVDGSRGPLRGEG
ncbi:helix-turn-helix domain-containing protein [Streptomyces sp. Ru62]|uniref:MmyB family transcriptional regulator n=1 Tax=Streptomyces sp. Ru62 TaxID=2080745 RepID=UPI0021564E93|nr:helix-turn-helix domain-containing protein [Streptomyces sp. Ru62]